jgi:hypothetical protein
LHYRRWGERGFCLAQEKLKPSLSWLTGQGELLENGDESHLSSAHLVGRQQIRRAQVLYSSFGS